MKKLKLLMLSMLLSCGLYADNANDLLYEFCYNQEKAMMEGTSAFREAGEAMQQLLPSIQNNSKAVRLAQLYIKLGKQVNEFYQAHAAICSSYKLDRAEQGLDF